MKFTSNKFIFTILGALIVPCFGRIALHGTNAEYDLFRYLIPLIVGGILGLLIGSMKDTLIKNKEKFRYLVESTSDWIWEVNQNGIFTYVSPKIQNLLGYKQQEALGKTPFDFMPVEEAKRIEKLFLDAIASCKSFENIENINLHKDGHQIFLETSGVPILDKNGSLIGYRGIDRDITYRKQAEKERDDLIEALKAALDNVNTLSGLVPICAKCKQIRDDKGYWNRIESYIEKHSEAIFSHGICPTCKEELYGDQDWYKKNKTDNQQ